MSLVPETLLHRFPVRLHFIGSEFLLLRGLYFINFDWFISLFVFELLIVSGPLTSAQLSNLATEGSRLRVAYQVLLFFLKLLA